ncbi:MAG: hypothetical protein JKY13_01790, partial [Gammaproteobacteria bacterium]|nr:hypothetical protein [Gammaproteobacteria bacterium]
MNHLLLYLHESQQWQFAVIDAENNVQQQQTITQLSDLPEPLKLLPATALLSGESVLITSAELPLTNRNKLLQAVPYAVEEQLIANVETYHFAFNKHNDDGVLPVAIVDKQHMKSWFAQLQDSGCKVQQLLPDFLALPYQQNTWHIHLTSQHAIVRTQQDMGFSIENEHLAMLLSNKLAELEAEQRPKKIIVYCKQHDWVKQLGDIDVAIEIQQYQQPLLNLFTQGLHTAPSNINLLQTPYTLTNKHYTETRKRWYWAGCALLTFCSIWLLTSIIQWSI